MTEQQVRGQKLALEWLAERRQEAVADSLPEWFMSEGEVGVIKVISVMQKCSDDELAAFIDLVVGDMARRGMIVRGPASGPHLVSVKGMG